MAAQLDFCLLLNAFLPCMQYGPEQSFLQTYLTFRTEFLQFWTMSYCEIDYYETAHCFLTRNNP